MQKENTKGNADHGKLFIGITAAISFSFSLGIELCQILFLVGTFQISDLVTNTAGGLIGGIIYWSYYRLKTTRARNDG